MPIEKTISLQDNTGAKKFFIPLFAKSQCQNNNQLGEVPNLDGVDTECMQSFKKDERNAHNHLKDFMKAADGYEEFQDQRGWKEISGKKYVQFRVGKRKIPSTDETLYGVWIIFETNSGDASRGYRIDRKTNFTEEDNAKVKNNPDYRPGIPYVYKDQEEFNPINENEPRSMQVDINVHDWVTISLTIVWIVPQIANGRLKTDLVIDLGNTRTVALLLDRPEEINVRAGTLSQFRAFCRPLNLKPTEDVFVEENNSLENAIVDTWFLLCKPECEVQSCQEWIVRKDEVRKWLKKEEVYNLECIYEYMPHLFAHISPVLCGDEAKNMYNEEIARRLTNMGAPFEQSSPKRYYWHNNVIDMNWCMSRHTYNRDYGVTLNNIVQYPPNLCGEICRFMPTNGTILDPQEDLTTCGKTSVRPNPVNYPRASTLTWFLLGILEKAWEQLNDPFSAAEGIRPRELSHVIGTYPSGWTVPEIEKYKKRWQEAIDIFHRTHFRDGESEIELDLSVDEAVAGQIPFLVGEVTKATESLTSWIRIAGAQDSDARDENSGFSVRMMNIDIGGGTTDISVIEHSEHPNPAVGVCSINCRLLSKESFTIAGDSIVKKIIEQIILPRLGGTTVERMGENLDNTDTKKRVRAVRGCLIPMANEILKRSNLNEKNPSISAFQCGCDDQNWKLLQELIGSQMAIEDSFNYSPNLINEKVTELFDDLLQRCSVYAYAYDVDYVFLSGKPSELPIIRDLVVKHFGLPIDRIIVAKNYLVGDWYPFGNGQFIGDAKSVTAVGCALKHALNDGRINGWKIFNETANDVRNQWSIIRAMGDVGPGEVMVPENGEILGIQEDEMNDMKVYRSGSHIARRQNEMFHYEPVYKLVSLRSDVEEMNVKFGRFRYEQGGEGLRIIEATTKNDQPLQVGVDIDLQIWPCVADAYEFWQDSGRLDV